MKNGISIGVNYIDLHETGMFKKMLGEIALLIGSIAAFLTITFRVTKYIAELKQKKKLRRQADINVEALLSKKIIKKVLISLGEKMGAQKILSLAMHNGGGYLDTKNPYEYVSVIFEKLYPQSSPSGLSKYLMQTKEDYQQFKLGEELCELLCGLPKEKIMIIDIDQSPSVSLKNIYIPQKVKTVILVFVGMDKRGMVFLGISYQISVPFLPPKEMMVLEASLSELKKLYKVI